MTESLADIGESGLIERIAKEAFTSPDMALRFQDDAALWQHGDGWLIASTDALVEDVDFRLHTFSWEDIGWKALAVNLSDIAAMGGEPHGAFVTLCLPAGIDVADVTAFYRGMSQLAAETQTPIVGGDLSSSRHVVVSVTVVGEVDSQECVLRRSAARPGDQIAVTGVLGSASAGLRLLETVESGMEEIAERFVAAQRRPVPRLRAGRALVAAGVRCGMDISDGLAADLRKLCAASGVSAEIMLPQVPTDPDLPTVFGDSFRTQAIAGGEDFELLFTASQATMQRARDLLESAAQVKTTVIGSVVPAGSRTVAICDENGDLAPASADGFDHFTAPKNALADRQ